MDKHREELVTAVVESTQRLDMAVLGYLKNVSLLTVFKDLYSDAFNNFVNAIANLEPDDKDQIVVSVNFAIYSRIKWVLKHRTEVPTTNKNKFREISEGTLKILFGEYFVIKDSADIEYLYWDDKNQGCDDNCTCG